LVSQLTARGCPSFISFALGPPDFLIIVWKVYLLPCRDRSRVVNVLASIADGSLGCDRLYRCEPKSQCWSPSLVFGGPPDPARRLQDRSLRAHRVQLQSRPGRGVSGRWVADGGRLRAQQACACMHAGKHAVCVHAVCSGTHAPSSHCLLCAAASTNWFPRPASTTGASACSQAAPSRPR
jgi:hypothetical protein